MFSFFMLSNMINQIFLKLHNIAIPPDYICHFGKTQRKQCTYACSNHLLRLLRQNGRKIFVSDKSVLSNYNKSNNRKQSNSIYSDN